MKQGWRGYISSRHHGAGFVPQRVQNLVIRDYAARHGLQYLLSAVEYAMEDSHMVLKAVLAEADRLEGAIFYSTHLLPELDELRHLVYDAFLRGGGVLRFALEEMIIAEARDIAVMEELLMIRTLARIPTVGMLEEVW